MPKQTVPLRLTFVRVFLSPVFLILFLLLQSDRIDSGAFHAVGVLLLWLIFTCIGVSDLLDGAIARRYKLVSDAGKVLDPLADVMSHTTYFICFVHADILWAWLCAAIIYRELMIIGMRMLLALKGVSFPAGSGGKFKTILFTGATIGGLIIFSLRLLDLLPSFLRPLQIATIAIFIVATTVSYTSFAKYVVQVRREKLLTQ